MSSPADVPLIRGSAAVPVTVGTDDGVYAADWVGWVMPIVGGSTSTWNVNEEPAAVKFRWTFPARSVARTAIKYSPLRRAPFRLPFEYVNVETAPGWDS